MKIIAVSLLISLAYRYSDAFTSPCRITRGKGLSMSQSAEERIAELRAAAAKAREDAARLSAELGKPIVEDSVLAQQRSMSTSDIQSKIKTISFETDSAGSQTEKLDELVSAGDLTLWKAAAKDMGMRTYPVSLQFLDKLTAGKVNGDSLGITGEDEVTLDDLKDATIAVVLGSSALAVAALALLPQNIGATVCYLIALVPVVYVGIGSTSPGIIANVIASTRGTEKEKGDRFDRICRHETAHFLCGYLVGLPVKDYSILESGIPCVEFHDSFKGEIGSREYTQEEVAALSVVSMSGTIGEIMEYGSAKGGDNDFIGLQNVFRKSEEFIGAQKQQELTRWGALTAYQLLAKYEEKYGELLGALRAKKVGIRVCRYFRVEIK
eukprot:CAMPEP_0194176906 /NCGR_PEP_ID=MMETSP0154-20130528/10772_1 /TAXON_ID=1049557 /ORGANISM="Thalassiothrix antarctica, Strain L6-D1" /LENGTH=380 /DNA_ID=CAMNT_0038891291 /DNA_START=49 /DNA_END=1191 /DNA_ORIENTATION=-